MVAPSLAEAIVKLSQRRRAMMPDGTPRVVDFVIDLERKYD
ncbi:hypothetical protein TPR58_17900 [Sphingomonas sp. HF-S3]|uniref:Uncharacterized protein n=1 Tax=Sphingomonas rustica TaxID=3103142 RepID=A0ABV0BFA7_9SPHN